MALGDYIVLLNDISSTEEGLMRVIQHFTGSELRNFTYLVVGQQGHGFIFDPWDGKECLELAQKENVLIKGVINTHEHWDHIQGNKEIVKKTDCPVYAHPRAEGQIPEANVFLEEGQRIKVDEDTWLEAVDTPGHTFAHLCLILVHREEVVGIFTGDTLFNAGVGHCRNGDPEVLFKTIEEKFFPLDDDIRIYPGHEYLGNNLGFTLKYEPQNSDAQSWTEKYKEIDWINSPITTTMGDEKKINLFLRLDSCELHKSLSDQKMERKQTFIKLRELRNNW